MMKLLETMRDALALIPGVQSCKIGLEDNICPDDYPIVRLVPSKLSNGITVGRRRCDLMIYFGVPIQAFDDVPDADGRVRLEKLYATLFDLESKIRHCAYGSRGKYIETITDEDRLDTYKLMAIRCEVEG